MSNAFTGGCACGAIRYEISSEPLFSNHCQCRDCQRKSGTGGVHASLHHQMGSAELKSLLETGKGRPAPAMSSSTAGSRSAPRGHGHGAGTLQRFIRGPHDVNRQS